MDPKLKQVADALIKATEHDGGMGEFIDSASCFSTVTSDADGIASRDVATFDMTKDHIRNVPRHSLGQRHETYPHTIGRMVYTVTITAKYEPQEE